MSLGAGRCPACGQGGFSIPKPLFRPTRSQALRPRGGSFCSKCGASLVGPCYTCKGRGYVTPLRSSIGVKPDRYCSECGREFEPEDDTCPTCGGDGELYDSNHFCLQDMLTRCD